MYRRFRRQGTIWACPQRRLDLRLTLPWPWFFDGSDRFRIYADRGP